MARVKKKRRDNDGHSVITANSLLDGSIYWLEENLKWSHHFKDSFPFSNHQIDAILEQEEAKPSNKYLVGIVEEAVRLDGSRYVHSTMKGNIRVFGPHSQD